MEAEGLRTTWAVKDMVVQRKPVTEAGDPRYLVMISMAVCCFCICAGYYTARRVRTRPLLSAAIAEGKARLWETLITPACQLFFPHIDHAPAAFRQKSIRSVPFPPFRCT